MFAKEGTYEACGIFTVGHFILFTITIIGIFIALKMTVKKNRQEIHKIIRNVTTVACILELVKIVFSIKRNSFKEVNAYVPLYYCSILLYAGLLSSFAKGTLKRVGDVFLATGSIVGGIVFMIYPSTSLPRWPVFHFISVYSFLYHGTMVYLGILINITKYIELKKEDIKYYASLILIICIIALIINNLFNGNLMFISNNFPGTPIEILYNITNGGHLYTIIMIVGQMTLPFYIPYYIIKYIQHIKNNKDKKLNGNKIKSEAKNTKNRREYELKR